MKSVQTSYLGLFQRQFENGVTVDRIEIPMLQRDYAHGRRDTRTNRIRENFLSSLISAITGGEKLSLDFVYGNVEGRSLMPLDGQQRLTTLFLLHWYVASRSGNIGHTQPWLNLSYATRASARMFCKHLSESAPDLSQDTPSTWLIDQLWYLQTWEYDPTIQSMLVVLDEIHARLNHADMKDAWRRLAEDDPAAITFHVLPMQEMGLGDDIYIKMNSRGKPLTEFELFKARFEPLLESSANPRASEFAHKIDREWVDLFWRPSMPDGAMDKAMVRYLRFLTDVCTWRSGAVVNSGEDLENAAFRVYGGRKQGGEINERSIANVDLMLSGLDTWIGVDTKEWFAEHFVSQHANGGVGAGQLEPLRLFRTSDMSDCDLFSACCRAYDVAARNREFGMPEALMLYAVLVHRWNDTPDVSRRLRIVRNLIEGSSDEMRADRMSDLIADVDRIMISGNLENIAGFNFRVQGSDERAKLEFLLQHPHMEDAVFQLEDHHLLRGCLVAFDLDEKTLGLRSKAFIELFSDDSRLLLISGALLAAGDYSNRVRGRSYCFGSARNQLPWREVFTAQARENMLPARQALGRLLDHLTAHDKTSIESALSSFIATYLTQSELEKRFDWRYYFVKYDAMRQGASGRYVPNGTNLGYSICMLNKMQMNSYYRDPYLDAVRGECINAQEIEDVPFTGYESNPRWMRLKTSGIGFESVTHGWHLQAPESCLTDPVKKVFTENGVVRLDDGHWHLPLTQVAAVLPDGQFSDNNYIDTVDRIQLASRLLDALVDAGC